MTLVVEDNTGLANAESYISAAGLQAYAAARAIDLSNWTPTDLEGFLRKAFTYVNSNWVWKSWPLQQTQAGEFPRINLADGMGRIWNVVPPQVIQAQCEAAIFVSTGETLFVVADRGGQIASEGIGPISTTYAAGAPAEKLYGIVSKLLIRFARDPNAPRRPLPSFNDYSDGSAPTNPVFGVGMDDNPLSGDAYTDIANNDYGDI